MVSPELLEILRCPACAREGRGMLTLVRESWLVCQDCSRKYPIVEDIPVMLISEGDKIAADPSKVTKTERAQVAQAVRSAALLALQAGMSQDDITGLIADAVASAAALKVA